MKQAYRWLKESTVSVSLITALISHFKAWNPLNSNSRLHADLSGVQTAQISITKTGTWSSGSHNGFMTSDSENEVQGKSTGETKTKYGWSNAFRGKRRRLGFDILSVVSALSYINAIIISVICCQIDYLEADFLVLSNMECCFDWQSGSILTDGSRKKSETLLLYFKSLYSQKTQPSKALQFNYSSTTCFGVLLDITR